MKYVFTIIKFNKSTQKYRLKKKKWNVIVNSFNVNYKKLIRCCEISFILKKQVSIKQKYLVNSYKSNF